MSRLIMEDAIFYLLSFYLVSSIIFGLGLFNTYLPNQCYNSSTYSLEPCDTTPSPSIWGNTNDFNASLEKYGQNATSFAEPGALLDPAKLVGLIGFYITFVFDMLSNTMLSYVLTAFIGAKWAHALTFAINLICVITILRVISGRLRWD